MNEKRENTSCLTENQSQNFMTMKSSASDEVRDIGNNEEIVMGFGRIEVRIWSARSDCRDLGTDFWYL